MWTLAPSMRILRVPLNDSMTLFSPKCLLCLDEASECRATLNGTSLVEWRLIGHKVVPLVRCYGGGLEHDCSTWDELYEDDHGEPTNPNAWNAPATGSNGRQRLPSPVSPMHCSLAQAMFSV